MSKKDQAIQLYTELLKTDPSPSRATLMKLFQDKLDMTPAGSSTYAAMVKSSVGGGTSTKPVKTSTTKAVKAHKSVSQVTEPEVEKSTDKRPLYSKCYFNGEEFVMSSSHYDKNDALTFEPTTKEFKRRVKDLPSIVIIGVPSDSETFQQVKEKYKIIG